MAEFPDTRIGRAARNITKGATPIARAEAERDFYDALAERVAAREQTDATADRLRTLEDLAFDAERYIAAYRRDDARNAKRQALADGD